MSRKPSMLYFHPLMGSLAEGVMRRCAEKSNAVMKGNITWNRFSDEWPNLFIENVKKDCAGRDVIFIGSLHSPDVFFEQVSILYSLPRYLSRSVTFVLPYFPTGTMERIVTEGSVATAATMARVLSAIPLSSRGPCQIIMFDIHTLQNRFYFGDNVIPRLESAIPLLLNEIVKEKLNNVTIVFPDEGAFKRFHSFFNSYPVVTCTKIREGDQRIVKIKEGDVSNRHCIIVDDLVKTGGTLIECAKVIKTNGASEISAYVTHGVFPKESWKKFTVPDTLFSRFYITDSVPHATQITEHKPFKLLSLSDILADVLLGYDLTNL